MATADEVAKPSLWERYAQIPCLRNSYLYGISSGIGSGLAYFLFSSRPGRSTHVGFSCFVATTMGYWYYCRYNWSKKEEQAKLLQKYLQGEISEVDDVMIVEGPVSV